jgi:hypothetical protein
MSARTGSPQLGRSLHRLAFRGEDEWLLLGEARRVRRPDGPLRSPRRVKPALLHRARTIHHRLRAAGGSLRRDA